MQSSARLFITWAPTKFHSRKFLFSHNSLHRIFPKTISPEIFPGIFTKNFSGTRDDCTVRDFPKMPHRTFRHIPASNFNLIQPTQNPSPYQPYFLRSLIVTVSQSGFNMGSDWVLIERIRARFGLRFQKSSKNRYFRNRTIFNGSNSAGSVGKSFLKRANLALQK